MSYKNNMMSVAIAILLASTTLSAAKANDVKESKHLDNTAITVSADLALTEDQA